MFERWFALDPGGYEFRLYDYTGQKEYKTRSLAAYEQGALKALGSEARNYVYREKPKYQVKAPLQSPLDPAGARDLLQAGLDATGGSRYLLRPAYLVCLDLDAPESEKQAWETLLKEQGASKVVFMDPLEFLQTKEESLLIHAGWSRTRIMLTSTGSRELNTTCDKGGLRLCQEIIKLAASRAHAMISREDAVALLESASTNLKEQKNPLLSCTGVDKRQQYVTVELRAMEIGRLIRDYEEDVVSLCQSLLAGQDPGDVRRILENGIFLSGGLASLAGFANLLEEKFNTDVHVKPHPEWELFENMKGWR